MNNESMLIEESNQDKLGPACFFYKSSINGWKQVEVKEIAMLTEGDIEASKVPIAEIMMCAAINSGCAIKVDFGCIHDDDMEEVSLVTSLPNPDSMMAVLNN